jgi:hypothetical protein
LADKAILWALISASTKEGRKACSLSYFACKAAEAELGLAYMAANDNKEFLTSLSNIMRYKIDAGLSESYTCYLLSKGKIIRPYLKNLNPLQLALFGNQIREGGDYGTLLLVRTNYFCILLH